MVDAAPAAYSWSGVSEFEFTRLVRHGRTRGRLSLDEVIADLIPDTDAEKPADVATR